VSVVALLIVAVEYTERTDDRMGSEDDGNVFKLIGLSPTECEKLKDFDER
jgi:hypothetical protein